MTTVRKLAIGVGALSALASTAHAQATSQASAAGAVAVIQPIVLSKTGDLNFGTIVRPTSGIATVAVTAGGGISVTGTQQVNTGGNPASAASFSIQGEGGSAYSVSVPGSFTMSNQNGAGSLTVNTVNNAGGGGILGGGIGSTTSATFGVGGTINLDTATASGAYTGTFTVTASYN